jgi:putative hemolysin
MLELERQISERYPNWFAGSRAKLTQPLLRGLSRFSRLDQVSAVLEEHAHLQGFAFVEAILNTLQVRYTVDQVERERIPQTGRLLIVANHPSGVIDAMALLHLVGSIRRDVKIVANDFLCAVDGIRDLLLPLRILGGRPSADSLAAIEQALQAEQCVIIFPAGEVSRLHWHGIADTRWRQGFLRFARNTGAPVLPVKIGARNSAFFYGASTLYKPLGTVLLPREAFARKGCRVDIRIGLPMALPADKAPESALASIRQALYAIGTRKESSPPGPQPLVHAVDRGALLDELHRLPLLGETPDGKRIHAGRLASDSSLLREIGRLRELSFRAIGEGTGKRLDVDAFDTWYEHIVLWDPEALEIAGAYRVARGEQVFAERGLAGFYTASFFPLWLRDAAATGRRHGAGSQLRDAEILGHP